MNEMDFKHIQDEKAKLMCDNDNLRKNLDKIYNQLKECQSENEYLKSKMMKINASAPDYETINRKLSAENNDLRNAVGVLADELSRLRSVV